MEKHIVKKHDGRKHNGRKRELADKVCPICNKEFRPPTVATKFCGNRCRLYALHDNRRRVGKFFDLECWTEEEEVILKQMYPDRSNELKDIQKHLPGRTIRAIEHRINLLRLKRSWRKDTRGIKRPYSKDISGENNPFFGRKHSEETKRKIAETVRKNTCFHRLNKDPEFQAKRRKALGAKPNKLELYLDKLIQEACPDTYRYVGDGAFIIDGLNPDWVSNHGERVIELFGRSFHDPSVCAWKVPYRSTKKGREKVFTEHGYKMLVIWDDELSNISKKDLITTIRKFHNTK